VPQHIFIVNPVSPRFSADMPARIGRRFPGSAVWVSEGPGDAVRLAHCALSSAPGRAVIVACGGDGTFREVASVVGSRTRLGILPLGTVNLVARELGIPLGVEDALSCLAAEEDIAEIYGGRCFADGEVLGRLFFIVVGAGPDADAVHWVTLSSKRLLRRYAYLFGFLARLRRPVVPDIRLRREGGTEFCSEFLALRMPHFGGPYRISEAVSLRKPGLELAWVEGGRGALLRFFWAVARSRVEPLRAVGRAWVEEASVDLPASGHFQVDGDPFRASTLRVVADPTPVQVISPGE
jgi:diacylglycerol kinase (ATP)